MNGNIRRDDPPLNAVFTTAALFHQGEKDQSLSIMTLARACGTNLHLVTMMLGGMCFGNRIGLLAVHPSGALRQPYFFS